MTRTAPFLRYDDATDTERSVVLEYEYRDPMPEANWPYGDVVLGDLIDEETDRVVEYGRGEYGALYAIAREDWRDCCFERDYASACMSDIDR